MQVVHTFNRDIAKQNTLEELPDAAAKTLIKTGRARPATEEEIAANRPAEIEPAPDQIITTAAPTTSPGTVATAADTPTQPAGEVPGTAADPAPAEPASTAASTPAKAEAKKSSGGAATSTTSTPGK